MKGKNERRKKTTQKRISLYVLLLIIVFFLRNIVIDYCQWRILTYFLGGTELLWNIY